MGPADSNHPPCAKILIVDDHPVVRAGLAMTLGRDPGISICGEADGVREAMEMIRTLEPNLILADLDLDGGSGLDLIKEVRDLSPAVPVLVLSIHDEGLYAERALRAGARGYLMKNESPARLLAGVKAVLAGEIAVSESMKALVVKRLATGSSSDREDNLKVLSDRELEVFREIGYGLGTRKIAEKLCLSVKTVESHVAHIKRKLGLQTATELQHRAYHWSARPGSH